MKPWYLVPLAAGLLIGCSKSAEDLASANQKLFQSADPQIKAQWDGANAALKTNGYAVAILELKRLQSAKLTPEQLNAVNETVTAVSDQMYEAANKGDAGAAKAIESLRNASGR